MAWEHDERDNLFSGHLACTGCGEALGLKLALQAAGRRSIAVVVPSCLSIILGSYPVSTFKIPVFHSAFESAAASACGISNALLAAGDEETIVIALAGDGGTSDIGFQALSGAADRNENIIYCCFDNEAYMNTGIQVNASTPQFAWTATMPLGKMREKKNMVEIMGAHKIPYSASACACFPDDLRRKIEEAKKVKGMKYIHILSPCPTGWRYPERLTPNIGRLAVETRYYPLYEIRDGREYKISYLPRNLPVKEYLSAQGRFKNLTQEELEITEKKVERNWEDLIKRTEKK